MQSILHCGRSRLRGICPGARQGLLLCALVLFFSGAKLPATQAAGTNSLVPSWLAAQAGIRTWSADFVQTRTLKSLAQPLVATGHVWFATPGNFRWELGQPPQTIAVRKRDEMMIIYPRLQRVERFTLSGEHAASWGGALALLEAGFPRNQDQLRAEYNVHEETIRGQTCEIVLEPKSPRARRMIPQIRIEFDARDFALRSTELQFADGSTMRNDFRAHVKNPQIAPSLFQPEIPADYRVVQPLAGQGG